jgi:GDP-L-fucose synthase
MILVAGATGFLGKRVCRQLDSNHLEYARTSLSLGIDLTDRAKTLECFEAMRPQYVLNCAAYVGGIQFGLKHAAEMLDRNLRMSLNLLEAAHLFRVKRLVNPISNCAYPGAATIFKEEEFWNGPLHESVLAYGMARKASWVGSWAYARQYGLDTINLVLSNLYGPEDHFEEERSHALGALIMKFVGARTNRIPEVVVWGSGMPVREWLHVDDGAEAMVRALDLAANPQIINIGVNRGISVADLARLVAELAGYEGRIVFDPSRPDGAPHKTVDGSRGRKLFGWGPSRTLRRGIQETIAWYMADRRQ